MKPTFTVKKSFAQSLHHKMERYVTEGKEMVEEEDTFVSSTDLEYLLQSHVNHLLRHGGKQLVVFDIDSTLLFGAEFEKAAPAKQLYDLAVRYGHIIYIVTARPNTMKNRAWTIESLAKLGVKTYRELFMAPPRLSSSSSIAQFKACAREYIAMHERQSILLNVGDRWGDLIPFISEEGLGEFERDKDTCADSLFILFSSPKPYDQVVRWNLKVPDEAGLAQQQKCLFTPVRHLPPFQMNRPAECPIIASYR